MKINMLKPSVSLTPEQVRSGLSYVTRDGLFTEAMVAFTGGTFLVAMAMQMGASNGTFFGAMVLRIETSPIPREA